MVEENEILESIHDRIDQLEVAMLDGKPVYCPLHHEFTNGMYSRTILMRAGMRITSLIHKTEHQFVVSYGSVLVKVNDDEWVKISAPYIGVTKPGTRRILILEEECVWTTFHPTDIRPTGNSRKEMLEAVDKIRHLIIEPHVNEYLGGEIINNVLTKTVKQ